MAADVAIVVVSVVVIVAMVVVIVGAIVVVHWVQIVVAMVFPVVHTKISKKRSWCQHHTQPKPPYLVPTSRHHSKWYTSFFPKTRPTHTYLC